MAASPELVVDRLARLAVDLHDFGKRAAVEIKLVHHAGDVVVFPERIFIELRSYTSVITSLRSQKQKRGGSHALRRVHKGGPYRDRSSSGA